MPTSRTSVLPAVLPESRLPILVTGVAGVAGYNAFHYLRERYPGRVIAIRREKYWTLHGPGIVACDAEDRAALRRLFRKHRFGSVLNCAGSCKLKSCELDPAMAERVNVQGVANLLDMMEEHHARLVHLSIDLVFSGRGTGWRTEHDPVDPVTVYGDTMARAEHLVLSRRADACVLRISLPMGVSFNGHAGAIDWIQSRFKQNKPATLYYDEIRTPTYTDCLNRVIEDVVHRDLAGLFHAGGPRSLSLFQIAQIVNRVGGYDPDCLMGCLRREAGPLPPRAGDVSLDSRRLAAALGYEPFDSWPVESRFVPTGPDWHRERSGGWRGSPELLARALYENPGWRSPANEAHSA